MTRLLLLFVACVSFALAQRGSDPPSTADVNAVNFEVEIAVPTSATDITTTGKDCWIWALNVANTSGSTRTFTLTDAQGSPLTTIPTVTIADKTEVLWNFPGGKKFTSGCKWTASGSGLTGWAKGKRAR